MRPLGALAVYILAVLLGGAMLAPWAHAAVGALAGRFEAFQDLARQPFSRYLTRCFLILALAGLWPLVRACGIRSWRDLGLTAVWGEFGRWGRGFVLGFGGLALVIGLALAFGARSMDMERSSSQIARHLMNATLAAVVVSILEEVLFRGAIFGALRRACRMPVALLASSGVYAMVHFFARVKWQGPVEWDSGLRALPQLLAGFGDARQLAPGFFNMTLAGMILALVYHRTGSLYAAMGLHAGWIFWLKTGGFFTCLTPGSTAWAWGSNKLLDGWLVLPVLGLTLLAVFKAFPSPQPPAPPAGSTP